MADSEQAARNSTPEQTLSSSPVTRRRVLQVTTIGFALLVGLVLLAAYLGYRGSDEIQDTAQELVRQNLVSARGAQIEAVIVSRTQELLDQLTWILGACFLLAALIAALMVWVIRRAFIKLEWQAAELNRVSWHLLDGHEKLARRFAHEMHDELGQSLSGLRRMLSQVSDAEFSTVRQECIGVVDEVLESVRKLSQVLRPVILDDFGLDSGIRWLCERFTQRTQIAVRYESNLSRRLAESEETHLFRITQEALTNIARHAQASEAWVSLREDGNRILLEIGDNGRGLGAKAGEHNPSLGIVGMRARARQLGGELIMQNRKAGGLTIRVEVPLCLVEANAEQEDSSFIG